MSGNGCYKSIWEVNHKLKHNKDLRDAVNEVLKEVDMEYKGTINVYHTAELLYNDKFIGVDKVRDSVTNPLTGAPHCRPLRLSPGQAPQGPRV